MCASVVSDMDSAAGSNPVKLLHQPENPYSFVDILAHVAVAPRAWKRNKKKRRKKIARKGKRRRRRKKKEEKEKE